MKEKILENTSIHYWTNDIKSDICLFFTHGVLADHRCFEKQEECFEEKYKIINWDMPLHGKSVNEAFSSYDKCADEMEKIIECENVNKVVLVGLSLGGYPSQMFINKYTENSLGFVAIDTTPFGLQYYSKSDIFWLKNVDKMIKIFNLTLLKKCMDKSISKEKYSYDIMLKMLENTTKELMIQQMQIAYTKFIDENKDIKINIPTIILVGKYDKTGKVMAYNKEWHQKTNFPLYIINNASHFSTSDNSKDVNRIIENFINKL